VIANAMEGSDRTKSGAYLDDVLNHTSDFVDHWANQQDIYDRLREYGLTFKISKTHINLPEIKFLGHILCKEGRKVDPAKIEAITKLAMPKTATDVRSLIGMCMFYRRYIPQFGDIVMPLHELTGVGVKFKSLWQNAIHGQAVRDLQKAMTSDICLLQFDSTKTSELRIDACRVQRGLGAILLQANDDGDMQPVAFYSKALSKAERKYSATELECMVLHHAILHFYVYLACGPIFDVYSDHCALKYMYQKQTATNNGRLNRYLIELQEFRFRLHYKAGIINFDADYLSRAAQVDDTPDDLDALNQHMG
jgi:hypothetical protein